MEHAFQRLRRCILEKQSVLCVGLDPIMDRLPALLNKEPDPQFIFNRRIVESVHDLACCFKLNYAFYSVRGAEGLRALERTIQCIHSFGVPVILDSKWGDIGHTAERYAQTAFERLNVDMVTLNPYMGEDSIAPFRTYEDRGSFVLCLTSNASRKDLQTQYIATGESEQNDSIQGKDSASPVRCSTLYEWVAQKIQEWNGAGNLGAVVGATAPEALSRIRLILGPDVPILCPGVGAQGGDLEAAFHASGAGTHANLAVNVSRGVIHASTGDDFAEAARREAQRYADISARLFKQTEITSGRLE